LTPADGSAKRPEKRFKSFFYMNAEAAEFVEIDMMAEWTLAFLLQSGELAELQKGSEGIAKQTAYSFQIDKSGGQRQNRRQGADIEGVFARNAVYLKAGDLEILRTSETTMVRLSGGEWKTYAEAAAELKKDEKKPEDPQAARRQPPTMSLEDLSKVPPPHILVPKLVAQMKKPAAGSGGVVKGELTDAYARDVLKQEWVAQGDDREWTNAKGTIAVTVNSDHLIGLVQLEFTGKILPENPRNVPRQPPQNPRQAQGMNMQDGNAVVKIKLDGFGTAKLPIPDELAKKLGLQ
jgi:hypothetical protein